MVLRHLQRVIEERMFRGKAIIVIGARQVGKSTLMRHLVVNMKAPVLSLNCDEPEMKELLDNPNSENLRLLIGNNKVVLVDEAQQVPGIGLTLKRMADNFPDVQILVTGSSSFDLQNFLNEPLTGRKYEYHLYPISISELYDDKGYLYVKQTLEQRLIYGSYPEVINHPDEAENVVLDLINSYLYKDLLVLDGLRRPALINKIVKALAFQVGSEVSFNELAQTVGTDNKTVEKYIDLLEKCFIVFRLEGLSRNLRNELKKAKKFYFWDNGVRNAVIQSFAPIGLRQDMGALWENFFISERLKRNHYSDFRCLTYFWRTTQQQEIDYVEEKDGTFSIFEMKWNPNKSKTKFPESFMKNYAVDQLVVVTPENYFDFLRP